MDKHELATQLRQRQYRRGTFPRGVVDGLDDDTIIDCYITCFCCGEKQADATRLPGLIAVAQSAEHFFALCSQQAAGHQAGEDNR